ncbi:MAG: transcription termination factor NusA [Firmicutes bacterium]|nr:transcription termination factor NusA [Bacillota bacterium]
MINKDFFLALEALEQEKKIKKEIFIEALESALSIAYKKHFGVPKAVMLRMSPDRNVIRVIAFQNVVEEVEDRDREISLEDARLIKPTYRVGDVVSEEISSKEFGRIAAQTAKQIVLQKLREVESDLAYQELSQKEDELISCTVRRIDGKNVYVEINKLEAALMPQDQMPNDRFSVGDRIKVFVKKIKAGHKGPQITISRTATGFVKKLFEIEVPEIASGAVVIKSLVREAGYRTKMAVWCEDGSIDPVGACVGNRGARVNSIVSQLGGEKIDIIPWCEDVLEFIARALSPAKVVMVQVNDDERAARVVVLDDMLSLAIGKDGQNARLAARLTGWKIDVQPYSSLQAQSNDEAEDIVIENEGGEEIFEEGLGELE